MENSLGGYDIFLSYAGRDEARAEQLSDLLKADANVFFAKTSIIPGDNFAERISQALLSARITAVLVSVNSRQAWYQASENAQAIDLARDSEGRKRVVPVYLDGRPAATDWNLFGLNVLHALDLREAGGMNEIARQLLVMVRSDTAPSNAAVAADHVLLSIPMGPVVPGEYIDESLIDAYAERFSTSRADMLLDKANAFRRQADAAAMMIRRADIPHVEQVEPVRYWQSVFREARLQGPRMLAALLLVVNDETFPPEAKVARRKLLDFLKAGAAHSTATR